MKKYIYFFFFFFFLKLYAQTSFHDTSGSLDVNGGGQLQYSLPIALPPGVKSIAPQINLLYSSNSTNGIAGYGWNISGITSISRTGRNLEKDGFQKGITLTQDDFFQYNGLRLVLVSGEYGKDGAIYKTEKHSNIKIKSIGSISGKQWVGPNYFEVTFEDGSQSWYGNTTAGDNPSITPVEYNIVKWKDAQGNYITYEYSQSENVSVINKISWGGNETLNKPHFNSIVFSYINRDLQEIAYLKGQKFIQSKLLNTITVNSNNSLFKTYSLTYVKDSQTNNYQYLTSITEGNSEGKKANPIVFTPGTVTPSSDFVEKSIKNFEDIIQTGDFDGDGNIDYIVSEKAQLGRPAGHYLYFDGMGSQSPSFVFLGSNATLISYSYKPFIIKSNDNIVNPEQGLLKIYYPNNSATSTSYQNDFKIEYYKIKKDASTLNNYNVNALQLQFTKTIKYDQYKFNYSDYTTELNESTPDFDYRTSKYLTNVGDVKEADIDGDGLSELLIEFNDGISYEEVIIPDPIKTRWRSYDLGSRYYVIDNDDIKNGTFHKISGKFKDLNLNKSSIVDFDNDGSQDIIYVKNTDLNKSVNFYTHDVTVITSENDLVQGGLDPNQAILKTVSTPINNLYQYKLDKLNGVYNITFVKKSEVLGLSEYVKFGDLNGDKNIEVLLPLYENDENEFKITGWSIYLNTGSELKESLQALTGFVKKQYPRVFNNYDINLVDFNNDGKSDILGYGTSFTPYYESQSNVSAWILEEFKYNENDTKFKWNYSKRRTLISKKFPYTSASVVESNFRINSNYSKIIILLKDLKTETSNSKLLAYDYFDIPSGKSYTKIVQGGITTNIIYKELDPVVSANFYSGSSLTYPYMGLVRIPKSFAVAQLQQDNRKQDFFYRGMSIHLQGRGMLGFQKQARSSWYVDGYENTKIWSVAEMDPYNEGVSKNGWVVRVSNNDTNRIFTTNFTTSNKDLISYTQTEYSYNYLSPSGTKYPTKPIEPTPNLITAVVPSKVTTFDPLKNIRSIETVTYNAYYLPESTIANINNGYGITTTTLTYLHNPGGNGKDYYIGRVSSKKVVNQAYGQSATAYETYSFENNQLSSKKIFNRDSSSFLTESYKYDNFGNIIEKIITNSEDTYTRNVKSEYDSQGKFVLKKIDNLGLITSMTYNNWGQVLTEIDPFGNKITNTYDNWGKILTTNHNLTGTTTFSYEKDSNGNVKTTQFSPDGNYTIKYTNKLGQEYKTSSKGFNQNSVVSKQILYDGIGRKIKESEPYYEGNSIQWNEINYDDTNFPSVVTATSFNNKKIKTSVNGMITLLKEENGYGRTTSQETDALGNVIKSTDPGGTITFKYNAVGQHISATYGVNIVTTKYDSWGRKSEFHDPSNGLYKYFYNGLGDPIRTESPKGKKEYSYNGKGQLINQVENATDRSTEKKIDFTYNIKGQLIKKSGTVKNIKNVLDTYTTTLSYATNGRLTGSSEISNGKQFNEKNIVYDDKGRISSYIKEVVSNGITTQANLENIYHPWSGILYQIKDINTGTILWQLDETLAGGQVTKTKLGNTSIVNSYNTENNTLTKISHSNSSHPNILNISYNFDPIKNELLSRQTTGDFNISETFKYEDNNNRLIKWTNPATGTMNMNEYDLQGRITENNQIGKISYPSNGKIYQPSQVQLNKQGNNYYQTELIQSINYNENNDPTFIDGVKGDAAFSYGLSNMRQVVTYGGNFTKTSEGKFTKYYDESGSVEIIVDNVTRKEKHILYIGGSPYESNIILVKDFNSSTATYNYLHKDYLGSILAITNNTGVKIEQRHFDAWGILTHLKIGNGEVITDQNKIINTPLFLERGYTSHEHFKELGIIHMNGRLYDPILRRFLNADENIQEPFNTQNYNKYGYVFNNPLLFNDPSGEIAFLGITIAAAVLIKGAIVGAFIGLGAYMASVMITNSQFKPLKALQSFVIGAVSGAMTAGVGEIFQAAKVANTLKDVNFLVQSATHGLVQGGLGLLEGNNFWSGVASGAFGSLGATAWGAFTGKFSNSAVGTITFGALSGGVGSELTGGNFWQGAVVGGIVAGLNHTLHNNSNRWDLNGDGKLSKTEADLWGVQNDSIDITVDNKKIDWSGLEYVLPKNIKPGDRFAISTVDAFIYLPYETAATYGGTSFIYNGKGSVTVINQAYHYEPRTNNPSMGDKVRNWATSLGYPRTMEIYNRQKFKQYNIKYKNPTFKIKVNTPIKVNPNIRPIYAIPEAY